MLEQQNVEIPITIHYAISTGTNDIRRPQKKRVRNSRPSQKEIRDDRATDIRLTIQVETAYIMPPMSGIPPPPGIAGG